MAVLPEMFWTWTWVVTAILSVVVLLSAGIIMVLKYVFQVQKFKSNLPRGSWSLPVLGETLSFLRMGPYDFLMNHFIRYGDMFTTSLFGHKVVFVNSPEDIKFILTNSSFVRGWPSRFHKLLGEGKSFQGHVGNEGLTHPVIRKCILSYTSGGRLHNLIPIINSLAQETVKMWINKGMVDNISDVAKYTFVVAMHMLSKEFAANSLDMKFLFEHISVMEGAIVSPMINLPGFAWHKAMKSRKACLERLKEIIEQRRKNSKAKEDGIADALMNIKEFCLSDDDVAVILLTLMFIGYSSTSRTIQGAIEYLYNNPEVHQRVLDEQTEVQKKMVEDNSLTCWAKYKSIMPFTMQVIDEVLRLGAPSIPKRIKTTLDYKGFTFRENSQVWAAISTLHRNPIYYPNPTTFDPSRFKETPKPCTFLPFGLGPTSCVGGEFARLKSALLIHHFVLNSCTTKLSLKSINPALKERLLTKMDF